MATIDTRSDDIDRLMTVMATAFDPHFNEAWSRRQVEDALLVGNCHYILVNATGKLASPGEEPAGFALSRHTFGEEELLLFAVCPHHRRKGIGTTLLKKLASNATQRGASRLILEMRRGNPAESLYSNFGFVPVGIRPNYYRFRDGSRVDGITFAWQAR